MTTLHFKQDVQTTLNSCHQKPNIYPISNYTSPKIGIKNIKKEVAMVNTRKMLVSTNKKETKFLQHYPTSHNYT